VDGPLSSRLEVKQTFASLAFETRHALGGLHLRLSLFGHYAKESTVAIRVRATRYKNSGHLLQLRAHCHRLQYQRSSAGFLETMCSHLRLRQRRLQAHR